MKKVYQKPTLKVVTFEMNEAIASCDSVVFTSADSCQQSDLGDMLDSFGINLTGDRNCSVPTYDYCYYTSVSTGTSGLLASS